MDEVDREHSIRKNLSICHIGRVVIGRGLLWSECLTQRERYVENFYEKTRGMKSLGRLRRTR